MDKRDFDILIARAQLETNNVQKISDETGIPNSTVHFRINEMRDSGILKNDLLDLDLEKIGINIRIITEVLTTYGENYQEVVGNKLSKIDGVSDVYFTMGSTDFIVIATLPSHNDVNQLINDFASIDEVDKTNSHFVIQTIKESEFPLDDYEERKLLDTLDIES